MSKATLSDDALRDLVRQHSGHTGIVRGILCEHSARGGVVPKDLVSHTGDDGDSLSDLFQEIFNKNR